MINRVWLLLSNLAFGLLPLTRAFGLRRWLLRRRGFCIVQRARFAGGTRIVGLGCLTVGDDTWIGPFGLIFVHPLGGVVIGARCDIAPQVSFITGSHEMGDVVRRAGPGVAAPIMVGDGCWIGARATVLPGVRIGEGAVVAAGAVVATDVAPHTLVGGVPARLIHPLPTEKEQEAV